MNKANVKIVAMENMTHCTVVDLSVCSTDTVVASFNSRDTLPRHSAAERPVGDELFANHTAGIQLF